eukprot:scaffold22580_cov210-Cylindrotheca_fusiformis.AAC.3
MKKAESTKDFDSRVTLSWIVYCILLLVRILGGPFLPGYVHPDELFQSGQELWFGLPPRIPWEFEPQNALRSVLPPGLLSWLPLHCYGLLVGRMDLSGMEVWTIPRLFCAVLSVITVDRTLWSLSKTKSKAVPISVLLVAIVTPWNALAYNSSVSNLKEHGLHSRWTHGAVNMFLLYGPMTAIAYLKIISYRWKGEVDGGKKSKRIHSLCYATLFSGLGFLSLAPHQEPRFLLPLLVPLVVIADQGMFQRKALTALWIAFNVILLVLFGGLHQSGVVRSLLMAGKTLTDQTPSALIYYHTYMPPSFLLRPPPSQKSECRQDDEHEQTCRQTSTLFGTLEDLNGSDLQTLIESLDSHLSCSEQPAERHLILATPPIVETDKFGKVWSFTTRDCNIPDHICQLLWQHNYHLSTEDLPSFDGSIQSLRDGLALNVFNITCSN